MKAIMPLVEQMIDADTRDDRSGDLCQLKAGLLLGFTENGKWKHYDPAEKDGSQVAQGTLGYDTDLRDPATLEPVDTVGVVFSHALLLADIRRIAREEACKAMADVANVAGGGKG